MSVWTFRVTKYNFNPKILLTSPGPNSSALLAALSGQVNHRWKNAVHRNAHKRDAKDVLLRPPQWCVGLLCHHILSGSPSPAGTSRYYAAASNSHSHTSSRPSTRIFSSDASTSKPCITPIRGYSSQVQSTESSSSTDKYALRRMSFRSS